MPTDSHASKLLKALRQRVPKLSVRKLSTELGIPPSSYAYYEDDFKDDRLPGDLVERLIPLLAGRGVPPIEEAELEALAGFRRHTLRAGTASYAVKFPDTHTRHQRVAEPPPPPQWGNLPQTVEIRGTAIGGLDGDFSFNGEIIDYARRMPGIANNPNVFCVYVRGTSMEPRYIEGDLLFLDPTRPPKPGEDVIVEKAPARPGDAPVALLKQIVARTPTRIVLRQFNPPNDRIEIPNDKILRISVVLSTRDLAG